MLDKILTFMGRAFRNLPGDRRLLVTGRSGGQSLQNWQLALSMSFVAGALNTGGFLMFNIYTSHVTGSLSYAVDDLILGLPLEAATYAVFVLVFFAGAFMSGLLVSLGQRLRFRSRFAFSLSVEASLLLLFAIFGVSASNGPGVPWLMALGLSFMMGMHNALVTTISGAEVRTTHMTGNVTDLGVEMSRLLYMNRTDNSKLRPILANRTKLRLHATVIASFVAGAFAGAWGFKTLGSPVAAILAIALLFLAAEPLLLDLRIRLRLRRRSLGA